MNPKAHLSFGIQLSGNDDEVFTSFQTYLTFPTLISKKSEKNKKIHSDH
jgi:hypothetical protein